MPTLRGSAPLFGVRMAATKRGPNHERSTVLEASELKSTARIECGNIRPSMLANHGRSQNLEAGVKIQTELPPLRVPPPPSYHHHHHPLATDLTINNYWYLATLATTI